jgi:hypothetical protein
MGMVFEAVAFGAGCLALLAIVAAAIADLVMPE